MEHFPNPWAPPPEAETSAGSGTLPEQAADTGGTSPEKYRAEAPTPREREEEMAALLEREAPGALAWLHEQYGIEHPGRYPAEVLLRMYERRDDEGPWGLAVYAKADHNDAFYHEAPLAKMDEEIGETFTTRVVECGSVAEARRLMARLVARHGRAGFLILNGHGNPEGLRLGEGDEEDETLTREAVNGRFGLALGECTLEGADVCLNACSTGGPGAVGEDVAAASGRRTSAPTADTAVADYGAEVQGNVVRFQPEYHAGAARTLEGRKD